MGRHWLLIPDLFPNSVVSFYWKNDHRAPGRSWRIRDYSSGTKVEYGPSHVDYTHDDLLAMAFWEGAAETIGVDKPYWFDETKRLNQRFAGRLQDPRAPSPSLAPSAPLPSAMPLLDEDELRRLRRGTALERMLTSPNSEDWVSWTVFRTLPRQPGWWASLREVAALEGAALASEPTVSLWRSLPSPPEYERASRARMAASSQAVLRDRAELSKPVEGNTEVDIVLEHQDLLWFIEAKLHSDLSANTTYDPERNQLVRNIDVLLEQAGGRRSVMSLLVLDRRSDRFYSRLVKSYKEDPSKLRALLPHRPAVDVDSVLRDLHVLLWSDLLPLLGTFEPADVRQELWRRCAFRPDG